MAKKELPIIGLDIGSHTTRVVVGRDNPEKNLPNIVGIGEAPSGGLRKGAIIDAEEAVSGISLAIERAERMTGLPIEQVIISLGNEHVTAHTSRGVVAVSKADGEIDEDDVSRVIEAAQAVTAPPNQEILHIIPKNFIVDNQKGIKDPVGMSGVRLEVEALIIYAPTTLIKGLTKIVFQAGIDVSDIVLSQLAASEAVLTKRQKELGVALVNVGGGTTGMAVFDEGDLVQTSVFPLGANNITNDIAIGLRTSVEIAEKAKLEYGFADPEEVSKDEEIDLGKIDPAEEGSFSKKELSEIIEARCEEIFEMIDKSLRKIHLSGKLPGGVVLTGGGAKLPGVVDVAKKSLKLPAQIGFPTDLPVAVEKIDDPAYVTALGLVLWGYQDRTQASRGKKISKISSGKVLGKAKGWFRSLLP